MKSYKLKAMCSYCGHKGTFVLKGKQVDTLDAYWNSPRGAVGYLQDLFPNVPAWIRSGAIDKYSGGFCICPKCCVM